MCALQVEPPCASATLLSPLLPADPPHSLAQAFWGISALNAYWVAKAAVAARSGGAVRAPMFDGVAHLAGE